MYLGLCFRTAGCFERFIGGFDIFHRFVGITTVDRKALRFLVLCGMLRDSVVPSVCRFGSKAGLKKVSVIESYMLISSWPFGGVGCSGNLLDALLCEELRFFHI